MKICVPANFIVMPCGVPLVMDAGDFRIAGRTKGYESIEEMQKDLDVHLKTYNEKRATSRPTDARQDASKRGLPKVKKPSRNR